MNGKWGIIDKNGNIVVNYEYADVGEAHEVNPDAEDHAVVMPFKDKGGLWGFKDFGPHGKGDIEAQFANVKYFNDGLCPVQDAKSGKWGYINNKGEVVIPYKFDTATVFQNRVAECMMGDDFLWVDQIGTLAEKSRLESNQLFSEGVALQQKKGKFIFINRKGKRAFRKKFRYADNFSEGLAVVQPLRSIKRGFIDTRGHLVIDDIYDDARAFSDQLAAVKVDPDEFFKIYNENGTPKSGKKKPVEEDEDDEDLPAVRGPPGLKVGARIAARWKGGLVYYPGRVVSDHGDGSYDIDYDDGDTEDNVPAALIKLQRGEEL